MRERDGVLISFRGLPGAGKTTAENNLVRSFAETRVGFGDSIKAVAYERVIEWQAAGPEAAALSDKKNPQRVMRCGFLGGDADRARTDDLLRDRQAL